MSHNIHLVKEKQKGHGEWSESMRAVSLNIYLVISNDTHPLQNQGLS